MMNMQLIMYQMLTANNSSVRSTVINHHKPRKRLSHQRQGLEKNLTTSSK
jgi:hypothetical protein